MIISRVATERKKVRTMNFRDVVFWITFPFRVALLLLAGSLMVEVVILVLCCFVMVIMVPIIAAGIFAGGTLPSVAPPPSNSEVLLILLKMYGWILAFFSVLFFLRFIISPRETIRELREGILDGKE